MEFLIALMLLLAFIGTLHPDRAQIKLERPRVELERDYDFYSQP